MITQVNGSQRTFREFIQAKSQHAPDSGFEPIFIPDCMFDFQKYACEWQIRKGRSALLAACGLGKTLMQLVWAENVIRHTRRLRDNRPAIIFAPLAVAAQTVAEAKKFGIEAEVSRDGKPRKNITVTNYEQQHKFNPEDYCAVVGDELSCIKAFDGKRRKQVTRFLSKFHYRLGATATPAPNDYIELGTLSEALGYLTQDEMLGMFFRSSDKKRHSLFKEGDFWNRAKYFFRPHAETSFWQWFCSLALAFRNPEDLGFDGSKFVLPPLIMNQYEIETKFRYPGELFPRIATTLAEQKVERKKTINERCAKIVELVNHPEQSLIWCQYNDEGDLLEKMIPGAVQVAGCNSDEEKEERFLAFANGEIKKLVTKPKIGAWGLNFQRCGHQTYFPSHSFEQVHQGISRSLRFGRVGPVRVDIVATEGEAGVMANLNKKKAKADEMFTKLVAMMRQGRNVIRDDIYTKEMEMPRWA